MMKMRFGTLLIGLLFLGTVPETAMAKSKTSLAQKAKLNLAIISNADYPAVSKRNEERGTTSAVYNVGIDGRVRDCIAFGASPNLDETTCYLFKTRLTFRPATNSKGEPVVSTRTQRMTWTLEKGRPISAVRSSLPIATLNVKVDSKGKVSGCKVSQSSGDSQWDIRQCEKLKTDGLFPTYNDEGKPTKAEYNFDVPRPIEK